MPQRAPLRMSREAHPDLQGVLRPEANAAFYKVRFASFFLETTPPIALKNARSRRPFEELPF
jgi:hypothetical protein